MSVRVEVAVAAAVATTLTGCDLVFSLDDAPRPDACVGCTIDGAPGVDASGDAPDAAPPPPPPPPITTYEFTDSNGVVPIDLMAAAAGDNGDLLVVGSSFHDAGSQILNDGFVARIGVFPRVWWLGGSGNDRLFATAFKPGGRGVAVGISNSFAPTPNSGWVVEIDADGTPANSATWLGTASLEIRSVAPAATGWAVAGDIGLRAFVGTMGEAAAGAAPNLQGFTYMFGAAAAHEVRSTRVFVAADSSIFVVGRLRRTDGAAYEGFVARFNAARVHQGSVLIENAEPFDARLDASGIAVFVNVGSDVMRVSLLSDFSSFAVTGYSASGGAGAFVDESRLWLATNTPNDMAMARLDETTATGAARSIPAMGPATLGPTPVLPVPNGMMLVGQSPAHTLMLAPFNQEVLATCDDAPVGEVSSVTADSTALSVIPLVYSAVSVVPTRTAVGATLSTEVLAPSSLCL